MTLPVPRSDRPVERHNDDVYRVTTAQKALSEDQQARVRRYLISMAIRTGCFIGVIFTEGWMRWVLVVGALVLPYVAVVMANAGRENDDFTVPDPLHLPTAQQPSITKRQHGETGDAVDTYL